MVEPQPSKLTMPVRSRSPAPHVFPGESLARPKSPKIHSSVGKKSGDKYQERLGAPETGRLRYFGDRFLDPDSECLMAMVPSTVEPEDQ